MHTERKKQMAFQATRAVFAALWRPPGGLQGLANKGLVPHITLTKESQGILARLGDSAKIVSLWHHIPYRSVLGKDTFTFVCEIPANTTAKMEMCKDRVNFHCNIYWHESFCTSSMPVIFTDSHMHQ